MIFLVWNLYTFRAIAATTPPKKSTVLTNVKNPKKCEEIVEGKATCVHKNFVKITKWNNNKF
jgi:hypothetical protein